jgi:MFS family permease
MLFFAARGLGVVLLQQAFNTRVPDAFRATANSLLGFGFSIAAAVTGPIAGAMVDAWRLSDALAALAVFSALVCVCLVTPLVLEVRRAARRAPA